MNKINYNLVSFSGGKDSTAMLLKMIEEEIQIDCILFCDTGLEFPEMYEHIEKIEKDIGRKIVRVKPKYSFEYLLLDTPVRRKETSPIVKRYGEGLTGYSWPEPRLRWCTSKLKDVPRERFLRELKTKYEIKQYVGIAFDEYYRLKRARNQNKNHIHPLVEWKMSEADCLKYCYERGYDWGGLYEKFDRVSCWCCPLQSLKELKQLYKNYPHLWSKLKEWEKQTWRNFRADYSVEKLEEKFSTEEKQLKLY